MRTIFFVTLLIVSSLVPAYGKTLSDLRTDVRYYLEEPEAYYYTDAELNFYINRAQHAICNFLVDDALIELSEIGTYEITVDSYNQTIPTDAIRIIHVFVNDVLARPKHSKDVWAIHPSNPQGETTSSRVPFYTIFDDSIRIYPLQEEDGTMEVWYLKQPTELSIDTQECVFREEIEHMVVMMATVYGLRKDSEFPKAQAIMEGINFEASVVNRKYKNRHLLEQVEETGGQ